MQTVITVKLIAKLVGKTELVENFYVNVKSKKDG